MRRMSTGRYEYDNRHPTLSSTVQCMVRNLLDFVLKAMVGIFILFGVMVLVRKPITVPRYDANVLDSGWVCLDGCILFGGSLFGLAWYGS